MPPKGVLPGQQVIKEACADAANDPKWEDFLRGKTRGTYMLGCREVRVVLPNEVCVVMRTNLGIVDCYENERLGDSWADSLRSTLDLFALTTGDPPEWSDFQGNVRNTNPPRGAQWVDPTWYLSEPAATKANEANRPDGWMYGARWNETNSPTPTPSANVRRRRWLRRFIQCEVNAEF